MTDGQVQQHILNALEIGVSVISHSLFKLMFVLENEPHWIIHKVNWFIYALNLRLIFIFMDTVSCRTG